MAITAITPHTTPATISSFPLSLQNDPCVLKNVFGVHMSKDINELEDWKSRMTYSYRPEDSQEGDKILIKA